MALGWWTHFCSSRRKKRRRSNGRTPWWRPDGQTFTEWSCEVKQTRPPEHFTWLRWLYKKYEESFIARTDVTSLFTCNQAWNQKCYRNKQEFCPPSKFKAVFFFFFFVSLALVKSTNTQGNKYFIYCMAFSIKRLYVTNSFIHSFSLFFQVHFVSNFKIR